jgi:hypothetical protein
VDHGVTTLDELCKKLACPRRSAWVRALVGAAGDEPAALLYLQAIVGPRPPGWRKQTWANQQCTFASAQMTSGRLATVLEPGEPHHLSVAGVRGTVEMHAGQFSFTHTPSLAQYGDIRLPWPSFVYNPPTTLSNANTPQGYLIGPRDVPSFSGVFGSVQRVLP